MKELIVIYDARTGEFFGYKNSVEEIAKYMRTTVDVVETHLSHPLRVTHIKGYVLRRAEAFNKIIPSIKPLSR